MPADLNLWGLWMTFIGGILLFCDSCRTSSRQTKDGFIFGFQGIWKWKVWDFAARIGFLLVTVGFALQLPAACAAK